MNEVSEKMLEPSTDATAGNERHAVGKIAAMPDIYAVPDAAETNPDLAANERSLLAATEIDERNSFNPYDTASLYKK